MQWFEQVNEKTYTPILLDFAVYPIQHIKGTQDDIGQQETCHELHI
jgi:hypothetical protein